MNRKGAILVFVLLIILVVVILANVALAIINSQSRLTHHQISRIRAYYASQAAMNLAFERLRAGNTASFSLCPDAPTCVGAVNQVIDADIPYRVDVTIGAPGSSIDGNPTSRSITITATYTYP